MTTAQQYPIALPNKGIVANKPEEFLSEQFSPYSRNMQFYNEFCLGRSGLSKFNSTALSGVVQTQANFRDVNGNRFTIFATPKDIYSYDFSNSRFDILTPLYQVGKVLFTNSSTKVYGGVEVDNCDDGTIQWADGSGGDVTPARTTTGGEFKEGTSGVKLTVGAGASVELLAYHNISSLDIHAYDSLGFWFKSTVSLNSGDLQFLLDNTAACASPLETINFPAISANTWTWVSLAFVTPSALTAVVSIGIKQAVDKGAMTLYIDQIVAGDWNDQLKAGDFIKDGSGSVNTGATWYEIASVDSDTSLTLTAVYAGTTAYQQSYVARVTFSGGDNDYWDWVQFSDTNIGETLLMTNGTTNGFVYWTGSGQFAPVTGLPATFTACKYLSVYSGRVIVGYSTEGGAGQRQRVRWSDVANCLSWQDIDFHDFTDEPESVHGLTIFNGYHVVFKEKNAYVGRYVGGDFIFDWQISPQAFGCRAPFSIVTRNDFIYYYGYDKKFHRFNLLQDDIISEEIFPETTQFDPNQDEFIQGFNVRIFNEIRWHCPLGGTTKFNYTFVWNYQQNIPQVWEYASTDYTASFGSFIRTNDVYADDPIYGAQYADETSGYADDSSLLDGAELIVYGGYDGYVRLADSGTIDDGTSYTRKLRLKRLDFNMPTNMKRLWKQIWWLEAAAQGNVTIKLRLNDKTTYESTTKTISLVADENNQDIIKKMITWDKEAHTIQPEISSTDHFSLLGLINFVFPKKRSWKT